MYLLLHVDDVVTDGGRTQGPFRIDRNSGIIRLESNLDPETVSYRLDVLARDDGGCCGGSNSRTSQGLVIVEVKDINNNAPRFPDCARYNPVVMEREAVGTDVITVSVCHVSSVLVLSSLYNYGVAIFG